MAGSRLTVLFTLLLLLASGRAVLLEKRSRVHSELVKSGRVPRSHSNHPRTSAEDGGRTSSGRYRRETSSCGLGASDLLEMEPVSQYYASCHTPDPPLPKGLGGRWLCLGVY